MELLFGLEPIAWVQHLFGLGHPLPFRIFSLLGDTWGMVLVAGVAFWLFGRDAMYGVAGVIAIGAGVKLLLSQLTHQARPAGPGIVVYEQLVVSSFPSGHVFEAALPWGFLYALGLVPLPVPLIIVLLVAIGRLYLGVHFLGDVLAGIVFAVPLTWGYTRMWRSRPDALRRPSARLLAALAALLLLFAALSLEWIAERPRRYEIVGVVMGACLALPIEFRFVRFAPSRRTRWIATLLGIVGIVLPLALSRLVPESVLYVRLAATAVATLIALCVAPGAAMRWRGLDTDHGMSSSRAQVRRRPGAV